MSADDSGKASPSDELDPDEPRTPLWLPLLGLALFLTALVYFLVQNDDAQRAESTTGAASPDAGAAPPGETEP